MMLAQPDTSEHFSRPTPSHGGRAHSVTGGGSDPRVRLSRRSLGLCSPPTAAWGRSQDAPFPCPHKSLAIPTVGWFPSKEGTSIRNKSALQNRAHQIASRGLQWPHNQNCVGATATPLFCAHIPDGFLFPKCQRDECGFPGNVSKLPHCTAPKRMEQRGHSYCPPGQGEKVKSIPLKISIYSTKTANPSFWEDDLRNK